MHGVNYNHELLVSWAMLGLRRAMPRQLSLAMDCVRKNMVSRGSFRALEARGKGEERDFWREEPGGER